MKSRSTASLLRVALVGNPNCGKTALFNALTGSRQKVANYPGVTVEKKEGSLVTPKGQKIQVIDLPGTYSLRGRSPDEAITRDVVLGQMQTQTPQPEVIVCVADATHLHLALRLVLEVKKAFSRPIVLALNMVDLAKEQRIHINQQILAQELGVFVVPTVAIRKDGITDLLQVLDSIFVAKQNDPKDNSQAQTDVFHWAEPDAKEIRLYHKEVERILDHCLKTESPDKPTWTERLDALLLHPVSGLLVLLGVFFALFQAVFSLAAVPQDWLQSAFDTLQNWLWTTLPAGAIRGLLCHGIVAGVGSVVVFLPQIITLFFFILILENSGYMARAAFLMDKLMGGVGLHGRAFIPLLSSFACAIPGILATRTIESKKDRLVTILIAPLMTCSARIPVYTLIIAAFIPPKRVFGLFNLQGLVMFFLYATGIVFALCVAFFLKKFFLQGKRPPLFLELPTYKIPCAKDIAIGLTERAKNFLQRAGTLILAMMIVIWFLSSYPAPPPHATLPAIQYTFAGMIGHFLLPVLEPIGFNWQISVALIPGMAAREVAVAALGAVYAISGQEDSVRQGLATVLQHAWSLPTALALLTWYVFAPQCASTLAVVKRETQSWRWPVTVFSYMLVLAYAGAFSVFHVSQFFLTGG